MHLRKKKSLLDQASDYVDSVRPQVEAALSQAVDAVEEFVESTAKPVISEAKERTTAVTTDARTKAAPLVAAGAAMAAEKAHTAKETAGAKYAALKGEEPAKTHKLRNLLLLGVLGAVAAVVARRFTGSRGGDNWQSSYVPTPPPPAPTDVTDDPGGAGPGEAISDIVDTPHAATTPDSPIEVVDIDQQPGDTPRP